MADHYLTQFGIYISAFDHISGVATATNSNGDLLDTVITEFAKESMHYRPYWIQGIPKSRLKKARNLDHGFVLSLTANHTVPEEAARAGLELIPNDVFAFGRYLLTGIEDSPDILLRWFSTDPIKPFETHLFCEILSHDFGPGQAQQVSPNPVAELLDPTTGETRFFTKNTITFPRRLDD